MSLLRRRMMMQAQQEINKIVFSDLKTDKCIYNLGAYNINGGIRFDFSNERDKYVILDFLVKAGKSYELEFDFESERDTWNTYYIANVYYGTQWYLKKDDTWVVRYNENNDKYQLKINPYTEDRRISLIGNAYGIATGYSIFKNLIIREV